MMKEFKGGRALLLALLLLAGASAFAAEPVRPGSLPSAVRAEGANHHVQGIAIDREAGRMYFSFTTSFVKTDLQGRVLGSIDKIQGHLGAITFNPQDRKVYASLECKDDVIGRGLSDFAAGQSMFYIAIIDVDALDRVGVHSEGTDIFKVVCIREAGADQAVLTIKSLEAFAKAADGKSTKIIIPSDIQGIAGLAAGLKEIAGNDGKAASE